MAKKQKLHKYWFADGVQEVPSAYSAICTKSGRKVSIYHKNLVKLIKTKYKDNFEYFLKNFVGKEQKDPLNIDANGKEVVDPYKLNAYSDYLIISYKLLANQATNNTDIKLKAEMSRLADCFKKHFNRDIDSHIKELT